MKILIFGDVVAKPGRNAIAKVLPEWKKTWGLDLVVANVENLAHGKGVTTHTLTELKEAGVDVFTSGNHIVDKGDVSKDCFELFPSLIRPANYDSRYPGFGYYRMSVGGKQILILNLGGKVFFDETRVGPIANPFFALDELLSSQAQKDDIILLDFHADATSEKVAMGHYCDGRITAMWGTHSHVPTADLRILPNGMAYITDVGMTGTQNSVLGAKTESALGLFLEKKSFRYEPEEDGPVEIRGVYLEIEDGKVTLTKQIIEKV